MLTKTLGVGSTIVDLGVVYGPKISEIIVSFYGGATYSVTPRGRVDGSLRPVDSTLPAIVYDNRTTGVTTAGTTPITADGIYAIESDGLEIFLDITVTAGSLTFVVNGVTD